MKTRVIFGALMSFCLGGCGGMGGLNGHDEFARYSQRSDTITDSAGDAKQVNAATHMNNPWPAYVGDRQMSTHGEKAAKAVECYRMGKSVATGGTTTTSSATSSGGTTTGSAQSGPTMSKGC